MIPGLFSWERSLEFNSQRLVIVYEKTKKEQQLHFTLGNASKIL